MLFQSSPGRIVCLILLLGFTAFAQEPETVVATVNGTEITLKQVDETVLSAINPLQQQLYAVRKVALDNLITAKLLETEAQAQRVSVEELREQLTRGNVKVTFREVEDAYAQNASFFAAMSPHEARERLRLDLENQMRMRRYRAGVEELRRKWTVVLKLSAPPALGDELDDGSPAKGPEKAAITIVEFSDFECSFCAEVQDALRQIMERYGGKVRLVFKHSPWEGHRNSLAAARAAYCAGQQDRFWQFHDALFASRNLSPQVFGEIAAKLGLGREKFAACVNAEASRTAVVRDIELAKRYGVDRTPSFLINGKLAKGALTFAEFQILIERELQQPAGKTSATN